MTHRKIESPYYTARRSFESSFEKVVAWTLGDNDPFAYEDMIPLSEINAAIDSFERQEGI
jgi:hypothetical protein